MDPRLSALAGMQGGTFSTAQARAHGADTELLRAAVRSGDLVRVRRGAYVSDRAWRGADDDERYRLKVLAVARSRPGDVLSHHAALAMHGLPLWDHEPARIDLEGDVRQVVHRTGVTLHPRVDADVVLVEGVAVVPAARAVVRTALTMGRDCAVVAGDQALRSGLVTRADLLAECALLTPHQGRARAVEAVSCMDGQAESVGESRTRLVLIDAGLRWCSQVVLRDDDGSFIARVDFEVEGVLLEFDGKVKYKGGEDPDPKKAAETVWREKRREDRIRRRGHPMERVVWDELEAPGRIAARVRAARPSRRRDESG